ncbi:MAG: hypothetical protein GX633_03160 [Clostridiales bacterium]|nr:hypothetical protein [Clostridiales bacterium]
MLEREFVFMTKHVDPEGQSQDITITEVSDYDTLRSVLLSTVKNVEKEKTVRLKDYSGNVENDVKRVLRDVNRDPLGAYVVNNIAYCQSKILTYYELSFTIAYRRALTQIAGIQPASGPYDLYDKLCRSIAGFPELLVFELTDYSPDKYDFNGLYAKAYYESPELSYGQKSFTFSLYPENGGANRIVEMSISYTEPGVILRNKAKETEDVAILYARSISSLVNKSDMILKIHDIVCSAASYDNTTENSIEQSEGKLPKTDPFTAYGALIGNGAVSEGYALAFRQLCDLCDIPCMLVQGKLHGVSHFWNLVEYGNKWYHVDASSNDLAEGHGYRFFALTDEEMMQTHTWDMDLYPAATASVLRTFVPKSENSSRSRLDTVIYYIDPTAGIAEEERTVSVEGILPEEEGTEETTEEILVEGDLPPDGEDEE